MQKRVMSILILLSIILQAVFVPIIGASSINDESQDKFIIEDNILMGISNELKEEITINNTVIIPDGVTDIFKEVFRGLGIKRVILPEGLKGIGDYAFADNDIEKVYFPESIDYISETAFEGNPVNNEVLEKLGIAPENDVQDDIIIKNDDEGNDEDLLDISDGPEIERQEANSGGCPFDDKNRGKITVKFHTGSEPLSNMKGNIIYELYNYNNEVVRTQESQSDDGTVVFDNLPYGNYKVKRFTIVGFATADNQNFNAEITPCEFEVKQEIELKKSLFRKLVLEAVLVVKR